MNLADKLIWLKQFYDIEELMLLSPDIISALHDETQPKKVKIGSLSNADISNYRVNSLDGYVPIIEWRNKGIKPCVTVTTSSGKSITASTDHFFEMDTGKWKYAEFIFPGEKIKSESSTDTVVSNRDAGDQEVFDFHIDHENHRYLTNGLSSHNSGSGKSLFMQNISVNWFTAGLNGIYLTLELSEGLCSMRIDSMVANCSTKDIFKNLDDVELKVRMAGKKSGKFQVKYLPAQSTVNDIRAFVKEFQVQTKCKLDFMMVDYLDLLMPVTAKVSPNDLFVKDKYVSEELRNLAKELNILFITASQLNRCLTLDTKVVANGNEIDIINVKVGDQLQSDSGDVTVTEVLPITKQPVYEITTKSGKKIRCSAKHKFPTSTGIRTIEDGLSVGEKLYIRSMGDQTSSSNSSSSSK